uniref:Uncharacterized protein n=1 Tax=Rhizophora mucronata TaxID=61149 RepID=A0A2P2P500_RHIMU
MTLFILDSTDYYCAWGCAWLQGCLYCLC